MAYVITKKNLRSARSGSADEHKGAANSGHRFYFILSRNRDSRTQYWNTHFYSMQGNVTEYGALQVFSPMERGRRPCPCPGTSRRLHRNASAKAFLPRFSDTTALCATPTGLAHSRLAVAALTHGRRKHVLLRFIVVGELLLKVMDAGAAIQERGVG
jgi:hypothetical protein